MNALWREGRTDEAIEAVQDMERRGIIGSASLYYDLARCLCSAGRCEEALVQVLLHSLYFYLPQLSLSFSAIQPSFVLS